MENDEFQVRLREWVPENCSGLLGKIPAGSGVCRIVNVPPEQYSPGYVSTNPGSYKQGSESGNWHGTSFLVAEAERPPSKPIFEVSCVTQDTPVLDMHLLPQELTDAVYGDGQLPSGSYEKSRIVLEEVANWLPPESHSGVYFPSRRADGGVFLFDPAQVPSRLVYSGQVECQLPKLNVVGSTPIGRSSCRTR